MRESRTRGSLFKIRGRPCNIEIRMPPPHPTPRGWLVFGNSFLRRQWKQSLNISEAVLDRLLTKGLKGYRGVAVGSVLILLNVEQVQRAEKSYSSCS